MNGKLPRIKEKGELVVQTATGKADEVENKSRAVGWLVFYAVAQ